MTIADATLFQYNAPLIGGELLKSTSLGEQQHINPSTGKPQASYLASGAAEIDAAAIAARAGAKAWRATSPDRRRDILMNLAALIERDRELFTLLNAREMGAPRMIPKVDIALSWARYYAGWADKIEGVTVEASGGPSHAYSLLEPYGVVGAIIPWNGPLVSVTMKVIPALAAGNAVILKPPTLTPFIPVRLAMLALEAGMPAGVLNVVPGDIEAGEALVRHPDVAKISFTGGGGVARKVAMMAAESLKPLAFELGGKSANLVFADADLDSAAHMATYMAMGLAGQGCVLPTRVYVEEKVHDEFMDRVRTLATTMPVGDPLSPETYMGPVISAPAAERIMGVIERAHADGASLAAGGHRIGADRLGEELAGGYFIEPTVFCNVDHTSHLAREEVFGPVLAVIRCKDEADAIAKANDSRFGLGGYLHTNDLRRAHRVAQQLHAGTIGINSGYPMVSGLPFGGYGESGYGREGGRAGLEEFLQHKSVYMPL